MVTLIHQTEEGFTNTMDTNLTKGSFIRNYLGSVEWIDHVDENSVITLHDLSGFGLMNQRYYRRLDTHNTCKIICWRTQDFSTSFQNYTHIKNKVDAYKHAGA